MWLTLTRYLRTYKQSGGPLMGRIITLTRRYIRPLHNGDGPEQRLRQLNRGFHAVSHRWDLPIRFRKSLRIIMISAAAAVGGVALTWYFLLSPWPLVLTLKHLTAFPNCDATEMV